MQNKPDQNKIRQIQSKVLIRCKCFKKNWSTASTVVLCPVLLLPKPWSSQKKWGEKGKGKGKAYLPQKSVRLR
jgi:hypothetical protein